MAEAEYERLLSLPLYPKMSDVDVDDTIKAVKDVDCRASSPEINPCSSSLRVKYNADSMKLSPKFSQLIRIFADATMVALCLLAALLFRFLFLVIYESPNEAPISEVLNGFVIYFVRSVGPIVLICFACFYGFGFYTRGRFYSGRYKAIIIIQAICIAYCLVALFDFLLPSVIPMPRSVLAHGLALHHCRVAFVTSLGGCLAPTGQARRTYR